MVLVEAGVAMVLVEAGVAVVLVEAGVAVVLVEAGIRMTTSVGQTTSMGKALDSLEWRDLSIFENINSAAMD
ncbi:hypothetical protein P5673_013845 [Acropora cervicornis]|uniref:Uncharacterized protein n=1 Tax=Acropora cervicornis TaxID=6130 RepID=A0AAD9V6D2_ACRCE|nr:hypothetical protein P5673_013845 [Acropora cervicornis]